MIPYKYIKSISSNIGSENREGNYKLMSALYCLNNELMPLLSINKKILEPRVCQINLDIDVRILSINNNLLSLLGGLENTFDSIRFTVSIHLSILGIREEH